jgi:serine/threonine-protein kinase
MPFTWTWRQRYVADLMGITDRLNTLLAGKYLIEDFIGAGGMGLVYAASHQLTRERVAVKFLRSELMDDPDVTRRFLKEARTVAQLKHRNAVRLMDLDTDPKYGMYMVFELLQGESLETYLAGVQRLPLALACEWLLPIMDVVHMAHTRNVLHRDIKPPNIFLHRERDGSITPKLLDFGLVRVMDGKSMINTRSGQVLGTPTHMSPEQTEGKRELGPSSDVWSMAVVWQRCLSGIEPFQRATIDATLLAVVSGDYKPLTETCPALPGAAALADVLAGALRADPQLRTQSMLELSTQLQVAARQLYARGVAATSAWGQGAPSARIDTTRRKTARRAVLGGGLAALLAAAAYWGRRRLAQSPSDAAAGSSPLKPPQPFTAGSQSPAVSPLPRLADEAPPNPAPVQNSTEPTPHPTRAPDARGKPVRHARELDLGEILVR